MNSRTYPIPIPCSESIFEPILMLKSILMLELIPIPEAIPEPIMDLTSNP